MKVFIICSKEFYNRIPPIQKELEAAGHTTVLPNSYDDPGAEEKQKSSGSKAHAQWKSDMFRHSVDIIKHADAVLVVNAEKNGTKNYVGGATFLEMYEAFRLGKKIYLYNEIPEGILRDEIAGFSPVIIYGDVSKVS